jgi:hypothetical protein
VTVAESRDLSSWADVFPNEIRGTSPMSAVFADDRWFLAAVDGGNLSTLLYSSRDGKTWERVAGSQPRVLQSLAAAA